MNQNTDDEERSEINNHDDNNSVIDLNDEDRHAMDSLSGNRQQMEVGSTYSNEDDQANEMDQFNQQNLMHNQRMVSFGKNINGPHLMLENYNADDDRNEEYDDKDWEIYNLYTAKIEQLESEMEKERQFSENQRIDIQNEIIKVNADKMVLEQQLDKV